MTRDHIGQSMRPAPTVPSYSEDGKAVDVGKGARGWTFSRSNHCYVSDEDRVNRLPGRGRGVAVHATEMTSPVVTLGAEVANPWRARCPERGTPGSEGGVGKHRVCAMKCRGRMDGKSLWLYQAASEPLGLSVVGRSAA